VFFNVVVGVLWTEPLCLSRSTPVDVQLLYQNTVQITAVLLFVLLLKMFYSNCMLGAARIFAGKRPPEDVYQAKSDRVSQEMLAAEDRARRIGVCQFRRVSFSKGSRPYSVRSVQRH
jgi:hypothetical protein